MEIMLNQSQDFVISQKSLDFLSLIYLDFLVKVVNLKVIFFTVSHGLILVLARYQSPRLTLKVSFEFIVIFTQLVS